MQMHRRNHRHPQKRVLCVISVRLQADSACMHKSDNEIATDRLLNGLLPAVNLLLTSEPEHNLQRHCQPRHPKPALTHPDRQTHRHFLPASQTHAFHRVTSHELVQYRAHQPVYLLCGYNF